MASKIHTPSEHVFFAPLDQGTLTSDNGTSLDCRGYEEALMTMVITTAAGATFDAQLQESTDNSSFSNVSGGAITQVPASQTKASRVVNVKLSKRSRYVRWVYTVTGTVTGCVNAVLFMPEQYPVSQTNAVLSV